MNKKDINLITEAYDKILNQKEIVASIDLIKQMIDREINHLNKYASQSLKNTYSEEYGQYEGFLIVKDMLEKNSNENIKALDIILNELERRNNAITDRMKVYGKNIDNMSPSMVGRAQAYNAVISWIKNPPRY